MLRMETSFFEALLRLEVVEIQSLTKRSFEPVRSQAEPGNELVANRAAFHKLQSQPEIGLSPQQRSDIIRSVLTVLAIV
ncbi:MAG: hypothetical protein JWM11_6519 [Planctomycetaceae bacterium]|nr:hypothetical protein [Planctomycetaceae bacterium]